jgi:hypothetical protein
MKRILKGRKTKMPVKFYHIAPFVFITFILAFNIGCEDDGINYENTSPNRPYSPIPGDGAQDQALDAQLIWSCSDPDGDPLTYDIFFGTVMDPPGVATGQTDTTYNPGLLDSSTTYYWQIIAHDPRISRTGPIWSFSTGAE